MECSPRGTTLSFTFILNIAWKQSTQIHSISRIAGEGLWALRAFSGTLLVILPLQEDRTLPAITLAVGCKPWVYREGGLPHLLSIYQFGLEDTIKGHIVQNPHKDQGYLQPAHAAESTIWLDLDCFQGWCIPLTPWATFACVLPRSFSPG